MVAPTYPYYLYDTYEFYAGVSLAVISTLFIGASFIIKKKALLLLQRRGSVRAGAGGFGYLREWMWWTGLLSMGVGEAANFAAYAFAPASLVTPLGALSVLVSAVLASKFLHERLNLIGKLGCLLCILGSTVIVLHAPKGEAVGDLLHLQDMLTAPLFLSYVTVVLFMFFSITMYFGPRYGSRNVFVYTLLCSAVGSLSVMACKGLGLALKETLSGAKNELGNWLTWFCLFSVVFCICVQMNYLNKALDLFSTGVVTPVYYVCFTTLVTIASSLLFGEWYYMSAQDTIGTLCGFSVVVVAIVLLNSFKDIDLELCDVSLRSKVNDNLKGRKKYGYCSDEEALVHRSDSLSPCALKNSSSR